MQPGGYDPSRYGDSHADVYDRIYANAFRTDLACRRLAELAEHRGGPVLDLGIGTGRLAVPLRQAGIDVHGIDASAAMIARLRATPDTADILVWHADMANFVLEDRYGVIVCAVSTLFMLPDRDTQIRCLQCAARHLRPEGVLVVEAFVPDPRRFRLGTLSHRPLVLCSPVGMDVGRRRAVGLCALSLRPLGQRTQSLGLGSRPAR